jgi:hypothetical protein
MKAAGRSVAVWLLIALAETLHGTARTLWLAPYLGDFRARQVAVFTGALIILAIATALIRWIGVTRTRDLLAVGLLWLVLTLAFEFSLGMLVLHASWERMTSDYNLARGGLLPLGMVSLTLSPLIATRIRAAVSR